MRYQHVDKKIPQRSVLIMSPYNINIQNSGPSYKCRLSFFEMCIMDITLKQYNIMNHYTIGRTRVF